jgi:RNA polymerase sigma-70 factor (ECF subfamily)
MEPARIQCCVEDGRVEPPDTSIWPDDRLIEAVRGDPPDEAALAALADRHWRPLYGRCRLLALDRDRAFDLAQEAWCRVLRARRSLRPDGNFPAYLATTALNIWRDRHRAARRAGALAQHRLAPLHAALRSDDGDSTTLADRVPDPRSLRDEEQSSLKRDIDRALGRLSPRLREALVARFLVGESCAEIGRRHGRTEQTISAWVREGLREMKLHLRDADDAATGRGES